MKKIKLLVGIIVLLLCVSCGQEYRYEYHSVDMRYQVVFDKKTGTIYSKMYGREWEVVNPTKEIGNTKTKKTASIKDEGVMKILEKNLKIK